MESFDFFEWQEMRKKDRGAKRTVRSAESEKRKALRKARKGHLFEAGQIADASFEKKRGIGSRRKKGNPFEK